MVETKNGWPYVVDFAVENYPATLTSIVFGNCDVPLVSLSNAGRAEFREESVGMNVPSAASKTLAIFTSSQSLTRSTIEMK